MIVPLESLRLRVEAAAKGALGDDAATFEAALHRSAHADYQADGALALARRLKRNPRDVAAAIAARLAPDDVLAEASVSGPGFLNLTVRAEHLAAVVGQMLADARLGVARAPRPEVVVIDYSSPNLAKEMHVGHLRSTIIGDALARTLEHLGHTIVRHNHIGDWGTPFGMLIEHLLDVRADGGGGVRELSAFYQAARRKFDGDPAFADRARHRVVLLQSGDEATLSLWRSLLAVTLEHLAALYAQLGVTLRPEHVLGESHYNPALAGVVAELERLGLARQSEGATCVFPPGFLGREGEPQPLIVRKQDGGYGYATTDLAAIRLRVGELGATRVLYVVGAPQQQHLALVFATARLAGWAPEAVRLEHVAFGSVLGQDRKILKSRAGEAVSLSRLLDEAVERAQKLVDEKTPAADAGERSRIARDVGIGAVKYADLVNDRVKDYVFDWNRMLAFDGNTAPYLMYAHARIRSILRKAEGEVGAPAQLAIDAPEERALVLELLEFPAVVAQVGDALQPHRLCQHLHDVATTFTSFYERCPVLKADPAARASRLALCRLTAGVLAQGLELLGIGAPPKM